MNTIAKIPARGGSKNESQIRTFACCGKPIIGYWINTDLGTGIFDEVVVSTDDEQIASVLRQFGASVYGFGPLEISDDKTSALTDGTTKMLQPEHYHINSQDLPTAYRDTGQFCWGCSQAIMEPESVVFSECAITFMLPANQVVETDTIDVWNRAELKYQEHQVLST